MPGGPGQDARGGKGQRAGKALEQYRGKQRGQCQQRRQGQRTLQQLYGGGSARQRCGCGVPDNGNDTLQYPLAGSQGRTVRRGCQCALQPQHKAEQRPAALEQPMQAAGKQRGGIPHAGVVPQAGRDRKAEIQLHDRQKQLLDDG